MGMSVGLVTVGDNLSAKLDSRHSAGVPWRPARPTPMGDPQEHRLTLLVDLVRQWGELGADDVMLETLWEVTGVRQ